MPGCRLGRVSPYPLPGEPLNFRKNLTEMNRCPGDPAFVHGHEVEAFLHQLGPDFTISMEILDEIEIFGPTHEDLYGSQVVGFKLETSIWTRYGDQAVTPPARQGFKNGVAQDIGVISVTQVVGPLFPSASSSMTAVISS